MPPPTTVQLKSSDENCRTGAEALRGRDLGQSHLGSSRKRLGEINRHKVTKDFGEMTSRWLDETVTEQPWNHLSLRYASVDGKDNDQEQTRGQESKL